MSYTVTVTKDFIHALPIGRGLGILSGTINVTSYNQTLAEITEITGQFNSLKRVTLNGVLSKSSQAVFAQWNRTSNAVELYNVTLSASNYKLTEMSSSVSSVGTVDFIAVGYIFGRQ